MDNGKFESSDGDNDSNYDLPFLARDLPRPHTFVYARALSQEIGKGKTQSLQLSFEEFLAGSLGLARRLSLLPERAETLAEYLSY